MTGRLLLAYLRLARLPSLPDVVVDAEDEERFALAAGSLLAGSDNAIPAPRLDFLRWLARERHVAFHGSPTAGITELATERKSSDTTAYGNQAAVYASSDPVWAIYFACLRRHAGFEGTRNGTLGIAGGPLYPRRYFFAHNRGSESPERFGPGTLYLLSPDTFVAQPPLAGVIDTAHLTSLTPVRPLASVAVTPDDFPFRDRIHYFRPREPLPLTILRA